MHNKNNFTQTNTADEVQVYYYIEIEFYGVETKRPVFIMNTEVLELRDDLPIFTERHTWNNNPLPSYCKAVVNISKYENIRCNRKRSNRFSEKFCRFETDYIDIHEYSGNDPVLSPIYTSIELHISDENTIIPYKNFILHFRKVSPTKEMIATGKFHLFSCVGITLEECAPMENPNEIGDIREITSKVISATIRS